MVEVTVLAPSHLLGLLEDGGDTQAGVGRGEGVFKLLEVLTGDGEHAQVLPDNNTRASAQTSG